MKTSKLMLISGLLFFTSTAWTMSSPGKVTDYRDVKTYCGNIWYIGGENINPDMKTSKSRVSFLFEHTEEPPPEGAMRGEKIVYIEPPLNLSVAASLLTATQTRGQAICSQMTKLNNTALTLFTKGFTPLNQKKYEDLSHPKTEGSPDGYYSEEYCGQISGISVEYNAIKDQNVISFGLHNASRPKEVNQDHLKNWTFIVDHRFDSSIAMGVLSSAYATNSKICAFVQHFESNGNLVTSLSVASYER